METLQKQLDWLKKNPHNPTSQETTTQLLDAYVIDLVKDCVKAEYLHKEAIAFINSKGLASDYKKFREKRIQKM